MPPAERAKRVRRWLVGYAVLLIATLPLGLPCWNLFLRDSIGRVLSVEALHVMEYVGFGLLAGAYMRTLKAPGRARWVMAGALFVGLLDETVQRALPGRLFQWSDVGWNALGIVIGVIGVYGAVPLIKKRQASLDGTPQGKGSA